MCYPHKLNINLLGLRWLSRKTVVSTNKQRNTQAHSKRVRVEVRVRVRVFTANESSSHLKRRRQQQCACCPSFHKLSLTYSTQQSCLMRRQSRPNVCVCVCACKRVGERMKCRNRKLFELPCQQWAHNEQKSKRSTLLRFSLLCTLLSAFGHVMLWR